MAVYSYSISKKRKLRAIIGTNLRILGRKLHMNQPSLQAKEIGLLMKMYIIECTEDDLRALRVMYEF